MHADQHHTPVDKRRVLGDLFDMPHGEHVVVEHGDCDGVDFVDRVC